MMDKWNIYVADFETTVYDGQTITEVWSAAISNMMQVRDEVLIYNNISDFMQYCMNLSENCIIYFHNLKFDGQFILYYIITELKYKLSYFNVDETNIHLNPVTKLKNKEYTTAISEMGQFYYIAIKYKNHVIEFRDSLKLLPFPLAKIAKDFKLPYQKLEMNYKLHRHAGEEIDEIIEKPYIKNDCLILKYALRKFFDINEVKLTIGSCCIEDFKYSLSYKKFYELFPNLTDIYLTKLQKSQDAYIRKAYKGGWCYVKKGMEGKIIKNGCTADVNSLYPFVMHSMSGSLYPVGVGRFYDGKPEIKQGKYYFIRLRCEFEIKKGYLPFIQIKNTFRYRGNEMLESSKIMLDEYEYDGDCSVELTLTLSDYKLFFKHYHVYNIEYLDYLEFDTKKGLFDEYIDKYRKIKESSEGAVRTLAKLFSNNLYGQLSKSDISSFKYPYIDENGLLKYKIQEEHEKKTVHIAAGAAVTAYARYYIISKCQKNYENFVYSDTDSGHFSCDKEELKDIPLDDKKYGCFKIESEWSEGIFVRQKTYCEVDRKTGLKITCAGMPDNCKEQVKNAICGTNKISSRTHRVKHNITIKKYKKKKEAMRIKELSENNRILLKNVKNLKDFKIGLTVFGKLTPKAYPGGVVLEETEYKIRA